MAGWTDENYSKKFTRKPLGRILTPIEEALSKESDKRNSFRDTKHLHPSSLSKNDWCPRADYYKLTAEPESNPSTVNLRRLNIFAEGHAIHDKWQRWMAEAGCLEGMWRCACGHKWYDTSPEACPKVGVYKNHPEDYIIEYREVPLKDEAHGIIGHADGIWSDDEGRAVVEIKSLSVGTIRWDAPALYEGYANGDLDLDGLWKAIKRPLAPHRKQANIYMHCLDLTDAIVIYEWKPTQEVKEFHLTRDDSMLKVVLDGTSQVWDAIAAGEPPPRPAGFMKSKQCKFCSFKDRCWNYNPE